MELKQIELSDIEIIKPYLDSQVYRACDYTSAVLYIWSEYFKYSYAIIDETFINSYVEDGKIYFNFPLGKNIEKALNEIDFYCKEKGIELRFGCVPNEAVTKLENHFSSRNIDTIYNRDYSDYIYDYLRLATLMGKKQSKHRNHVNKFRNTYPSYKIFNIGKDNIQDLKEFLKLYPSPRFDDEMANHELKMINHLLDNLEYLNQEGAYVEVDGKIVAFAIGEVVKDTLYVHVEKALREYDGAFAFINQMYARFMKHHDIKYINREEDLGNEGLRKAKESYHPEFMIEKYSVIIK